MCAPGLLSVLLSSPAEHKNTFFYLALRSQIHREVQIVCFDTENPVMYFKYDQTLHMLRCKGVCLLFSACVSFACSTFVPEAVSLVWVGDLTTQSGARSQSHSMCLSQGNSCTEMKGVMDREKANERMQTERECYSVGATGEKDKARERR